jgi:DNA (cytosine-5)-methyltransferase 1
MYGLDLFSGIGGITKALEGYVRPVAYCENDRYCQAVLLSRQADGQLPIAPIWDDVRTLSGPQLPSLDIIYGGSPCQDISNAGRRKGLGGKRSGLFFEIIRIVSEIRPKFVFLENVSAINRLGLGTITAELTRIRYDCRWGVLSASDVGAPHQRDRWWLLAHPTSDTGSKHGKQQEVWTQVTPRMCGSGKSQMADASINRLEKGWATTWVRPNGLNKSGWWGTEPNMVRVVHGIPYQSHRIKSLGNSVVPAQAREAFERLMGLK